MSELLQEFITESRDLVENVGQDLLALEDAPDNSDLLNAIFRSVHTMKGASGLFDIRPFTKVVHSAEEVLDRAREGDLSLNPDIFDIILAVLDQVTSWLDDLEAQAELAGDSDELAEELRVRLAEYLPEDGGGGAEDAGPNPFDAGACAWLDEIPADVLEAPLEDGKQRFAIAYRPDPQACFTGGDPFHTVVQLDGLAYRAVSRTEPWTIDAEFDPYVLALEFRFVLDSTLEELDASFRYVLEEITGHVVKGELLDGEGSQQAGEEAGPAAETGTVAVDMDPALAEEALELVRMQRQLLEATADGRDPGVAESACAILVKLASRTPLGRVTESLRAALGGDEIDAAILVAAIEELEECFLATIAGPAEEEASTAGEAETQAAATGGGASSGNSGGSKEKAAPSSAAPKALRVDQARIDELMNLIGELVVAKNGLPFLAARAEDTFGAKELSREIKGQYGALNRIAEDLQSAVMSIRMVPLSRVFQRFPRLVRDLSRKTGKEVRLVLEGEEAEIDKNSVDDLGEPLIHMIRNSLDHGIEQPDDREAVGKSREGTVKISARQLDDQVMIEVSDDGAGIDPERLRRKAVEKGIITAEKAAALSEKEALELILAPGFSTAEEVSELSGRGVGMDVLRTMVANLGGHLTIKSELGKGTVISFSIPLSVAVTRVMMIEVGGECFGIPIDSIIETVRLPRETIKQVERGQAIVLRDRLIPVCWMRDVLHMGAVEQVDQDGEEDNELFLVVRIGDESLALIVDRVHEGVDTIVKPLEGVLGNLPLYSGSAILGDGRVMLELDIQELARCL